jgi:hypothetical protein
MSLYRPYFTPAEIAYLDAASPDDLTHEIDLLRSLLAGVLQASQRVHALALAQHAAILSAFCASGRVLARLVRLQCQLHHPLEAVWAEIERGKELGRQRRHVYSYLTSLPAA